MNNHKPKIVCVDDTFLNDRSYHHLPLFEKYFKVSEFDPALTYSDDTTFMYRTNEARRKVKKYEGSCRFIADSIWEPFFWTDNFDQNTIGLLNRPGQNNDGSIITVPKWLWYEEHFSQQHKKPLLEDLPFNHAKTKSFLLQMGKKREYRVRLYNQLKDRGLLDDATYSFLSYGIALEGNFSPETYDERHPPFFEREYKPDWYNRTKFSLVAENTFDDPREKKRALKNELIKNNGEAFVSEKSMKPIMFGHPFIILGDRGICSTLESWGFYTFPELFDKEFDKEHDINKRTDMIVEQVANYRHKDVKDKVLHNFNHFWNTDLVMQSMKEEIIEPILNFINSK